MRFWIMIKGQYSEVCIDWFWHWNSHAAFNFGHISSNSPYSFCFDDDRYRHSIYCHAFDVTRLSFHRFSVVSFPFLLYILIPQKHIKIEIECSEWRRIVMIVGLILFFPRLLHPTRISICINVALFTSRIPFVSRVQKMFSVRRGRMFSLRYPILFRILYLRYFYWLTHLCNWILEL